MKIYRNTETGETLTPTNGGGLSDTKTGITSYDTEVINRIIQFADDLEFPWIVEEVEPNLFDTIPKCVSLDGDSLEDYIVV